ncbi:MAG TPA: hypothetical protein VF181_01965 [Balneolaceae bacterium]
MPPQPASWWVELNKATYVSSIRQLAELFVTFTPPNYAFGTFGLFTFNPFGILKKGKIPYIER